MRVNILTYPTDEDWLAARNCALATHRKKSDTTPSSELRTRMLISEHSPIRTLSFLWEWVDIPYWVSVHFSRHSVGITHFVSTQRNDRQYSYDRRDAPQKTLVNHRVVMNADAILNVSRKRLCLAASAETRLAWEMFLAELEKVSPELALLCVKPCVYRNGICPEVFSPCAFNYSKKFEKEVAEYNKIFPIK